MPNHVQNCLQFTGSDDEIKELLASIKNENMQIDFNKIIEQPKQLQIDSNSWFDPITSRYDFEKPMKAHLDEMRRYFQNQHSSGAIDNFIQGIRNYLELGYATWYEWNLEHWGTKWNAYNQNDERNSDFVIYFQTAWSAPVPVILELSKKYPELYISLAYADEDSGCNTGFIVFKCGEIKSEVNPKNRSNEAYELYFSLHPGERDNYELVDGKWEFKEDETD